jgi:cytochrome bd-I ubiquinol oxidase subunit X
VWYFSWLLGLGLALAFGVLNAMWYELIESKPPPPRAQTPPGAPAGMPER